MPPVMSPVASAVPAVTPSFPFSVQTTAAKARDLVAASWSRRTTAGLSWDPARHVQSRFAFGPGPGASDPAFDPDAWWADQVSRGRTSGPYGGLVNLTSQYASLQMSATDTAAWLQSRGNVFSYDAMNQLAAATLLLQTYSSTQLFEVLVDVFANHLNVANMTSGVSLTRTTFDRDVIRANVFGDFTSMLLASAKNVAMQSYLNLNLSSATALNENYGRELLELHTVGKAANYTQAHVVSSARIMTGRYRTAANEYCYVPARHWVGPVTVLGFSAANSDATAGEQVGDDYLRYLASHPSTATNIARKLCVRFVSDNPSAALVAATAKSYLDNNTAILPTVSTIFRSTEFWAARGAKMRRPAENLVATIRALGLPVADNLGSTGTYLQWASAACGQAPLSWGPPNGFPDVAPSWCSAGDFAALWGQHLGLSAKWWPTSFGSWATQNLYGGGSPTTSGQAIDALSVTLLGTTLPVAQRQAVLTYLGEPDTTPMATSSIRGEFTNVAALILHGPQHSLR